MAFMRKQAVIEALDINTIAPDDAEKRITAGVKKYATNEVNFAEAQHTFENRQRQGRLPASLVVRCGSALGATRLRWPMLCRSR